MECATCKKPLVKFGTFRKNGNDEHKDYKGRKLHLKCWKREMEIIYLKRLIEMNK